MAKLQTPSESSIRKENFLLLLYPEENESHARTMSILLNPDHLEVKPKILYIEHKPECEGKKKHTHVLVNYDRARFLAPVLRDLEVTSQWCRFCDYRLNSKRSPYLYFTHANKEGSIQYSVDSLKGDPVLVGAACRLNRQYRYGHEFVTDSIPTAIAWINAQVGRYIMPDELILQGIRQGFAKALSNRFVKEHLDLHNKSVLLSHDVDPFNEQDVIMFCRQCGASFGDIRRFTSEEIEGAV